MIDITQWQATIGTFNTMKSFPITSLNTKASSKYCIDDEVNYSTIMWFVSIYYVLNIFFSICLILSGDIETNPGPVVYKICPKCEEKVHIKKKSCLCGHIFIKKSRDFKAKNLPSISCTGAVDLELSSTGTIQTTTCAPLSKSPIDVTNKSLDSNTSIGLSDVIAHDVSCSAPVGETSLHTQNESDVTSEAMKDYYSDSHVDKDSQNRLSESSVKWAKRSSRVNARRRLAYKLNPEEKRFSSQKYYHSQPGIRSQQVLHAYHANPSPAKKRMLDAYHSHPSPIKQRSQDTYHTNPSPIRLRVLQAYHNNPSPAKQRMLDAYYANPSPIKRKAMDAYKTNPSPIKQRAMDAYKANPSPVKWRALQAYYREHELNKKKRRQVYEDNRTKILDKRHISKLVAWSVSKKYSKMRNDMPASTTTYISRLLNKMKGKSYAAKHLEAQHLVTSCMQYRGLNKAQFIKEFHHLRTSVLAVLSKVTETASEIQRHDIFCGEGLHTSSTESYFPKTTYNAAAFDENGNLLRDKFPLYNINTLGSGTETWHCSSELCSIPSKSEVNQAICDTYTEIAECDLSKARYFIQHMDDCTKAYMHDPNLRGHNKACHVDPNACGSRLLYLRRLAPHYPNLRRIINMLYTVTVNCVL